MKLHAYLALAALSAHLHVACGAGAESTDAPAAAAAPAPVVATAAPEAAPAPAGAEAPAVDLGDGWLGVALDGDLADAVPGAAPPERQSVRVTQVFPGTPAAASEFLEGDVILRFGDDELVDVSDLIARVRASRPGTTVAFTIRRGQEMLVQPVMLGTRPEFDELLVSIFLDEPAPPLTANALSDNSALDIRPGELVVLDFWTTWCGPCRRALPGMNDLHARFSSRGVRLIGISPEEPSVLHEFLEETSIDYTVAYDLEEATTRDYYITAYPTVFVIDQTATVRHIFIGGNELGELEGALETLLAEASSESRSEAGQ